MAYTHNFEVKTNLVDIEGQINFNGNQPPKVKITTGNELDVAHRVAFDKLIEELVLFNTNCGSINKIEFNLI